jgi:hypothetical protein
MPSTREQVATRLGIPVSALTPEAIIDHELGAGTVACLRQNDRSPGQMAYPALVRLGQQMLDAALADGTDPADQYRYTGARQGLTMFRDQMRTLTPDLPCFQPGGLAGYASALGGGGGGPLGDALGGAQDAVQGLLGSLLGGPHAALKKGLALLAGGALVVGGIALVANKIGSRPQPMDTED